MTKTLSATEIRELMEGETLLSDEWNDYFSALIRDLTAAGSIPKSEARRRILELLKLAQRESRLSDIAQTALAALTRVEELEKELANHKPKPVKCDDCGATTPDVSYRPNAYANDVGNDPTAMHTVCDECDLENKMDI